MAETEDSGISGTLVVTSPEGFPALLDVTHDEHFELDDLNFDEARGVVEIPFWRMFHGGPERRIKKGLTGEVFEVDVLRCLFRVHNVKHVEIIDEAKIGTYSLNYLKYDEESAELVLVFCEDCEMRLTISAISLEVETLGYRGKAQITRDAWGGDSNTSEVYE